MEPVFKEAANAAGKRIRHSLNYLSELRVQEKSPNDFVTEVDQRAEQTIVEIINKAHPRDAILAEEGSCINLNKSERVWIIDPLDGTRNYMHDIPHYAVSIALQVDGVLKESMIYDPFKDETFTAVSGSGARVNNRRIRVSQTKSLEKSLVAFGFPFRQCEAIREKFFTKINQLMPLCSDVRRSGSAALDLAYVAAGRYDAFWEFGLESWDIAAGALLIKEAGGFVLDMQLGENYLQSGDVVAANPTLIKNLLQVIAK